MSDIYPVVSPHLYGRRTGKDSYRIFMGTVAGYVRDKASNKIIGCVINGNKGETAGVQARLSAKSNNEWDIPQEGEIVLWGYMNGDLTNPYILYSAYQLFNGEVDPKLFKKIFPSGAVWQIDSSGNMSLTIPGTTLISGTNDIEIETTGDDKNITIDTTKGNVIITAVGSGKKVTLNFGSATITIESGKMTLTDGSGTVVINGGQINMNSGNLTVDS